MTIINLCISISSISQFKSPFWMATKLFQLFIVRNVLLLNLLVNLPYYYITSRDSLWYLRFNHWWVEKGSLNSVLVSSRANLDMYITNIWVCIIFLRLDNALALPKVVLFDRTGLQGIFFNFLMNDFFLFLHFLPFFVFASKKKFGLSTHTSLQFSIFWFRTFL